MSIEVSVPLGWLVLCEFHRWLGRVEVQVMPGAGSAAGEDLDADETQVELSIIDEAVEPQTIPNYPDDEQGTTAAVAVVPPPESSDPYGGSNERAARVVDIAADNDAVDEVCGICFEPLESGKIAKMLCCRNRLCLNHAQRVGQCPYCRQEPLMWGLE